MADREPAKAEEPASPGKPKSNTGMGQRAASSQFTEGAQSEHHVRAETAKKACKREAKCSKILASERDECHVGILVSS